ncbi:MAG: tetratricopeptide repeat protein [bacterium]
MRRAKFLFGLPILALLFFQGCAKTPESSAVGKAREAIALFIQNGTPTDKAIALLEEAAGKLREPFIEETLALFYLAKHPTPQWKDAIPHLEKSQTKFAKILLGEAMLKEGKWLKAEEYLKDNKDPFSLFLSAYSLLKEGKQKEARRKLEEASSSKEKIPLPLIFSALGQSQPLACAGLRYTSLRWLWDNLEKMGREIKNVIGGDKSIVKIGSDLANYSMVRPEYISSLSFLKLGLDDEEKKEVEKAKKRYLEKARKLEDETTSSLYRLTRLLIFITFAGLILVGVGILMIMVGLVKGRSHPLWKKGFITAGIGFALWIVLMLLFYPMPFGGMVQGYVAKKFYNAQYQLIRNHWDDLGKKIGILKEG